MLYLTSVARLSPDLAGFICSGAILMEAVGGMVAGRVSDQFYSRYEVDEFVCGRRREGSITSLTSVLGTLVISAGLWIVGVFLDFSGYDPHLAAQVGRTLAMIENLFVLFPSVLLFFAAIFLKFYPMSRERFYILKEGIERKKAGGDYGELLPQIKKLL